MSGVVAADPGWPAAYQRLRALVSAVLGPRVVALDHVGSTAVPGPPAKPIVDLDLEVADSADEACYLPDLVVAGFGLISRDREWEEHRCLTYPDPNANLHVWTVGAIEPRRHRLFRDWLAAHPADRQAYAELKLDLSDRHVGADYNEAKSGLVYDIYERAFAADPAHPHTPHPRR